jgi:uncharacterized protein DUF4350
MTRTGAFVAALVAALAVALVAWFMQAIEWVEIEVPTLPRGEAARDRFYVAKQLARRLGAEVTTVRSFERLPPPGATLVLGSRRWNMFPGREAGLRRWIEAGGHLVVLQSAWSAQGDTPDWVPMRSRRPRPHDGAASATPAASATARVAPAAPAPTASTASTPPENAEGERGADANADAPAEVFAELLPRQPGRCPEYAEPARLAGAFGAPRRYRICGSPSRVLRADSARWLLAGERGVLAARVPYGRGDISASALEGSLSNNALLRDDGALAFAALLQLKTGDRVWFVDEETRARFLALLWQNGAPALWLAAAATVLLLWRGGARFGPLLAERPRARRSIGEQVRRTAAFIAAGGGAALHRASVRALEEEARRSIAGYGALLGVRERSEAIARRIGVDAGALAGALSVPSRSDRHFLAAAIARLEHARRALESARRRVAPTSDASPPTSHASQPSPP